MGLMFSDMTLIVSDLLADVESGWNPVNWLTSFPSSLSVFFWTAMLVSLRQENISSILVRRIEAKSGFMVGPDTGAAVAALEVEGIGAVVMALEVEGIGAGCS